MIDGTRSASRVTEAGEDFFYAVCVSALSFYAPAVVAATGSDNDDDDDTD